MVLVDTSVWVSFFREPGSAVRQTLDELLEDDAVLLARPVRIELLSGAGRHSVGTLRRSLDGVATVTPSADTWDLVERWVLHGAERGLRFAVGDLLIAATAAERGALLWTLDEDFTPMTRLRWIRRFQP